MVQRRRGRPRQQPQEEQRPEIEPLTVRGRWESVEQLPIVFANQMFVGLADGQVFITFGYSELPMESPLGLETRERLEREGVPIHAVARLVIAPAKLGQMLAALNQVYGALQGGQVGQPSQEASQ